MRWTRKLKKLPHEIHVLLEIRNLSVEFGSDERPFAAVQGVDLDVAKGELLGIVGESGSGKSVSMLAVMGLIEHPAGCVPTCCASTATTCWRCRRRNAAASSAATWRWSSRTRWRA